MQSALKTHSLRLRTLKDYFRNQERCMADALQELQQQLDSWHESNGPSDEAFRRELCEERDELHNELSHVRQAIAGTDDELIHHEGHLRLLDTDIDCDNEVTESEADTDMFDSYELLGA